MTAPQDVADLRLTGPGLTGILSGPTPLVEAVAFTLTRLLASSQRRVNLYLTLLRHSDADGHYRLYQAQLAALTGLSTRHPRPQPNTYLLPLRVAIEESAPPDSALSAKEEAGPPLAESPMIHEHDADSLADKTNRHLLFLHEGQRRERLAQPHCTPAYLQAWDEWWTAGRFGRLRNPAGWANLQIKAGHSPPLAPVPLPLLPPAAGSHPH